MKPKKKKKMPTYVAEVWSSDDTTLIGQYESLCAAIAATNLVPSVVRNIYYLNGTTWLQWNGPRPVNPPGR